MKRSPLKRAKDEAWKWFSQYIRKKYANEDGWVECVTCGKSDYWKDMQAGHYVDGRGNAVLLNEKIVFPQCFKCNMKRPGCLSGNKNQYTIFLMRKKRYSLKKIEELEALRHVVMPLTEDHWRKKAKLYKKKAEKIKC